MVYKSLLFAVLCLLGSVSLPTTSATGLATINYYADLVNTRVERVINLQSQVEETMFSFQIENQGSQPVEFYLLPISGSKIGHLSHAQASSGSKMLKVTRVAVQGVPASAKLESSTGFLKIDLLAPLKPKGSFSFHVLTSFTRVLRPFPAEIAQNENQLVLYEDNLYVFSLYKTVQQTTQVKLASSKIESYTKKSAQVKGDVIEYGPYIDIAALSVTPLAVHFENNNPFVTMTSMKKLIEISHFGNVNVEEWYNLEHTGALLKGSFSRYEYQRNPNAKGSSFRQITAVLPPHATDLYYRDQIGNVSTSHVRQNDKQIEFEVLPRFPMFGGWKTDFYIGYNLPLAEYLSTDAEDSSTYVLNISFGSPFPQAAIDEEEVRVILPEFATNIRWVTPFEVDAEGRDVHVTYLDTVGRPVLVLTKKNVIRYHAQPFQVVYNYSKVYMLQEPLILSSALFLFFLSCWLYMRIDLSISESSSVESSSDLSANRSGRQGTLINRVLVRNAEVLRLPQNLTADDVDRASSSVNSIRAELDELKKDSTLVASVDRVDAVNKDMIAIAKKCLKAGDDAQRARLKTKAEELQHALSQLAHA